MWDIALWKDFMEKTQLKDRQKYLDSGKIKRIPETFGRKFFKEL